MLLGSVERCRSMGSEGRLDRQVVASCWARRDTRKQLRTVPTEGHEWPYDTSGPSHSRCS